MCYRPEVGPEPGGRTSFAAVEAAGNDDPSALFDERWWWVTFAAFIALVAVPVLSEAEADPELPLV